jgi:hypothetical protein
MKQKFFWVRLPASLVLDVLPKIPAATQALFFHLLSYSDAYTYKDAWPGLETLRKVCGFKTVKSVKDHLDTLRKFGLINSRFIQKRIYNEISGKYSLLQRTEYTFNLAHWQEEDVSRGFCKVSDWINPKARQEIADTTAKNIEKKISITLRKIIDTQSGEKDFFSSPNIPENLRVWREHLEFTGIFQGTAYFKCGGDISPAFAEEQFRKAGIAIKILRNESAKKAK